MRKMELDDLSDIARQLPSPEELLDRRNRYSYPAVGLEGSPDALKPKLFHSVVGLENHNAVLLGSSAPADPILGYLSVLYWGHYSGSKGDNPGRAIAKVSIAKAATLKMGPPECLRIIFGCAALLRQGHYGVGLVLATKLPQMQFAFGSKLCAFLNPSECGVIDSVIAEQNPFLGFAVDGHGYVKSTKSNASKYSTFCRLLTETAHKLNTIGPNFRSQDQDGQSHAWRAIDVERSLYAPPITS